MRRIITRSATRCAGRVARLASVVHVPTSEPRIAHPRSAISERRGVVEGDTAEDGRDPAAERAAT